MWCCKVLLECIRFSIFICISRLERIWMKIFCLLLFFIMKILILNMVEWMVARLKLHLRIADRQSIALLERWLQFVQKLFKNSNTLHHAGLSIILDAATALVGILVLVIECINFFQELSACKIENAKSSLVRERRQTHIPSLTSTSAPCSDRTC